MQTVWVTGGAGFTGRFMIRYLKRRATPVRIVAVDVRRPAHHDGHVFLESDFCNEDSVARAVEQAPPDVVIHLAGLMPPHSEGDMRRVNVGGSVNLARALASRRKTETRLISAGSAAEYLPGSHRLTESAPTGGTNAYGRTKSEQSAALVALTTDSLHVIIARPFNLVGPGLSTQLVAGALCEQFSTTGRREGFIAPKGSLTSTRDFIDVRDVVAAYSLLAEAGIPGEIYNVCSAVGTKIGTVIEMLRQEFDLDVDIRSSPDAAGAADDSYVGDNTKLSALGWRPATTLQQSLHDMVQATNG